uniref:Solute carrier family 28 member 2 n=1 Tax=Serinus canaria TaxID=9135 RepID=A0A8C9NUM9_SERCA
MFPPGLGGASRITSMQGPNSAWLCGCGGKVSGASVNTVALSFPRSPGCFKSQWAPVPLRLSAWQGTFLWDREEQNILEAASNGAATSVGLVANIAANLIAFLAVLEFINAALRWFGEMVDIEGLTFQVICSYVLMPLAFLMGADWADSPLVAELLGVKIFLNEFVAYQQLATYKKNRLMGLEEWDGSRKQWISERAESITTFALCGFANFSSIGIMLGGLSSLVPQRKSDFASVVLRALFTGMCVSMLNACLAGLLYVPTEVGDCAMFFSTTNFNSTSYTMYTCCKQLFARWV